MLKDRKWLRYNTSLFENFAKILSFLIETGENVINCICRNKKAESIQLAIDINVYFDKHSNFRN